MVVSDDTEELKRDMSTGGEVAVGTATGAVGAGIGATIGALAIGIPTFGVAAGAGLVLGDGVAADGGTAEIWNRVLKNLGRNHRE